MICHTKKIGFVSFLASIIFLTSSNGLAQGCPSVSIQTPDKLAVPDQEFVVSATVKNAVGIGEFKYDWTVSHGTIVKGQGSEKITVVATREHAGTNITVSTKVSGFSSFCSNTATEIFGVAMIAGCVRPMDEFQNLSGNEVKAIVDNLFVSLANNPDATALFEMDFVEAEPFATRRQRVTRVLDAIRSRKYDLGRTVFVISNEKERSITRAWLVPANSVASDWVNRGTLIYGSDMKEKTSTLF